MMRRPIQIRGTREIRDNIQTTPSKKIYNSPRLRDLDLIQNTEGKTALGAFEHNSGYVSVAPS
jgi:hypothetical protein